MIEHQLTGGGRLPRVVLSIGSGLDVAPPMEGVWLEIESPDGDMSGILLAPDEARQIARDILSVLEGK